MVGRIDQIMVEAEDNRSWQMRIARDLVVKTGRPFFNLDRAWIWGKVSKAKLAMRAIISLRQIQTEIKSKKGKSAGDPKQIRFMDILRIRLLVVRYNTFNLFARP